MARTSPTMACIAVTLLVLAACAAGELCGTDANRLRTRYGATAEDAVFFSSSDMGALLDRSCGAKKSRVAECCTGFACGAKHTCVPTCALIGCLPPICPDGTVPPIVGQATGIYPDCCPHFGEVRRLTTSLLFFNNHKKEGKKINMKKEKRKKKKEKRKKKKD